MKGAERPAWGAPDEARRTAAVSRLLESRALAALGRVPGRPSRAPRARRRLRPGHVPRRLPGPPSRRARRRHRARPGVAEEARRTLRRGAGLAARRDPRRRLPHDVAAARRASTSRCSTSRCTTSRRPRARRSSAALREHLVARAASSRSRPRSPPARSPLAPPRHRSGQRRPSTSSCAATGTSTGFPIRSSSRRALRDAGFAETGEVPVVPGGSTRFVWGRRRLTAARGGDTMLCRVSPMEPDFPPVPALRIDTLH